MKVVFDTNVLFAALVARRGFCAGIIQTCILRHQLILSEDILNELREKLNLKSKLSKDAVEAAIAVLRSAAVMVAPLTVEKDACRDPHDLVILGTAAVDADVLVTGDEDLLVLVKYGEIPIISPREFHDRHLVVGDGPSNG